jgi:CheY-like chemotaxis protein
MKDQTGRIVLRRAKLLLVDDHRDSLAILMVMLEDKYEIQGFVSPEEALKNIKLFSPDLLVLDVAMAPIDGVQFLRTVRAMPEFANVPAIALTAFAREVDKAEFRQAGFQAVMTKPILDLPDLQGMIEQTLEEAYPALHKPSGTISMFRSRQ